MNLTPLLGRDENLGLNELLDGVARQVTAF